MTTHYGVYSARSPEGVRLHARAWADTNYQLSQWYIVNLLAVFVAVAMAGLGVSMFTTGQVGIGSIASLVFIGAIAALNFVRKQVRMWSNALRTLEKEAQESRW